MGEIIGFVSAALFPIAFVVLFIFVVVRRGFQMKLLLDDGIETTGTVVQKFVHRGGKIRSRHLRYEYTDQHGARHGHRSMVGTGVYDDFEEGSAIRVIYSASKPQVSAPKYLVELSTPAKSRASRRADRRRR